MIEIVIFSWVFAFLICLYAYILHKKYQGSINILKVLIEIIQYKNQKKMKEKELNKIAQEMFGVNYNELGVLGQLIIDDKLKELKPKEDE
jgi:hypothetical protein